jgi:hypothetical protein
MKITETCAVEELEQLGCQWRMPESERAQNEIIEAYRDVALDSEHAQRITKHLLQHSRRFPLPADVRAAAEQAKGEERTTVPLWRPKRHVCSVCSDNRFVVQDQIRTRVTRTESIDGDPVEVFVRWESRNVSPEFARSIRSRRSVVPASWKRSMRDGLSPQMAGLLTEALAESYELAENEELTQQCVPCTACFMQREGAA